jgi:type I restriction enzyme S subunit
MKAWQGSCGVSNFNGIVSPAYFVFDLRFENKRFFDYAIRSRSYKAEFARISSGIRVGQWDLSIQGLKNVVFSYPSAPVQDRIVRWLDWQTSRIAHYTRTKKREIECLRELKKAIISEAVTRGLDPHAKMKRAMTYFEHDIPKHWNEVKIKRVLTPLSRSYDADEEILMLSSSSIICNIYSWMLELYELYENIDL